MKEHLQKTNKQFKMNEALILLSIIVSIFLLRFPFFLQPWGADQGVYGYIANGILDGKVPYRDMYSSTGYGIFFTYALLFKIFANNMTALHIGDFITSLMTVLLVYFISRILYRKECAIIAGAVAALFGSGQAFSGLYDMKGAWGTYWQLAQREAFMTTLIAAAILLIILSDRHRKRYLYFGAGILIGLAAILKVTSLVMLMIVVIYIVLNEFFGREGGGLKQSLMKTAIFISGAAVIQLPFLYYFWSRDSLSLMYKAVFLHTSLYAKLSRGNVLANAFQGNSYILLEDLALWLFSFAAMIHLMINKREKESYLVTAWTLGTLFMVWGQGKFFGYHYLLLLAPFSVLTGFGIKNLLKSLPTWRESFMESRRNIAQVFMWVILISNLLVFAVNHYEYYRWNGLYLFGKISRDKYYEVFNEFPLHLYSFPADYEVANYLKAHAPAGASLCTVNGGGDTIINYLSGLKSATRFTSTWYLFNKGLYDDTLTDRLRDEFIEGIKTEKPEYMLLIYYSLEEIRKEYSGSNYEDVGRLMDYINDNYVLEKAFRDRRTLYKRI